MNKISPECYLENNFGNKTNVRNYSSDIHVSIYFLFLFLLLFTILNETVSHTFYTLLLIAIYSIAIETPNKRLGLTIPLTKQWDTDQRAQ